MSTCFPPPNSRSSWPWTRRTGCWDRPVQGFLRPDAGLAQRPGAVDEWNKLNLVLVISTEPYLLINDITIALQRRADAVPEGLQRGQVADLNHVTGRR